VAFGNGSLPFFRRQHELLALAVVIAPRPAVIGALSEDYHFLRWQLETLLGGAQMWPTFMQLIAAVTGRSDYGLARSGGSLMSKTALNGPLSNQPARKSPAEAAKRSRKSRRVFNADALHFQPTDLTRANEELSASHQVGSKIYNESCLRRWQYQHGCRCHRSTVSKNGRNSSRKRDILFSWRKRFPSGCIGRQTRRSHDIDWLPWGGCVWPGTVQLPIVSRNRFD
jgi:hypothetical protein